MVFVFPEFMGCREGKAVILLAFVSERGVRFIAKRCTVIHMFVDLNIEGHKPMVLFLLLLFQRGLRDHRTSFEIRRAALQIFVKASRIVFYLVSECCLLLRFGSDTSCAAPVEKSHVCPVPIFVCQIPVFMMRLRKWLCRFRRACCVAYFEAASRSV